MRAGTRRCAAAGGGFFRRVWVLQGWNRANIPRLFRLWRTSVNLDSGRLVAVNGHKQATANNPWYSSRNCVWIGCLLSTCPGAPLQMEPFMAPAVQQSPRSSLCRRRRLPHWLRVGTCLKSQHRNSSGLSVRAVHTKTTGYFEELREQPYRWYIPNIHVVSAPSILIPCRHDYLFSVDMQIKRVNTTFFCLFSVSLPNLHWKRNYQKHVISIANTFIH